jgi:hypothetical protein
MARLLTLAAVCYVPITQLKVIDPKSSRSAKLLSGHLSSADAAADVFATPAAAAYESAVAAARHVATSGDVALTSLSQYYGDRLRPDHSLSGGYGTFLFRVAQLLSCLHILFRVSFFPL